jgi:hypothetical protein
MPFLMKCPNPSCAAPYTAPDEKWRQWVTCPVCETRFEVGVGPTRCAPRIPPACYEGKYIAWTADGFTIRDGDEDYEKLRERLREQGEDPDRFMYGYVSPECDSQI